MGPVEELFSLYRNIICVHQSSGCVFRLSEAEIVELKKGNQPTDWLSEIDIAKSKLELKISEKDRENRSKKNEIKAHETEKAVKDSCKIISSSIKNFQKLKINPQNVKALLNPVLFVSFEDKENSELGAQVRFIDTIPKDKEQEKVQKNIDKVIEHKEYSWHTVIINEDGSVDIKGDKTVDKTSKKGQGARSKLNNGSSQLQIGVKPNIKKNITNEDTSTIARKKMEDILAEKDARLTLIGSHPKMSKKELKQIEDIIKKDKGKLDKTKNKLKEISRSIHASIDKDKKKKHK